MTKPKKKTSKVCIICGETFLTARQKKKTCSPECHDINRLNYAHLFSKLHPENRQKILGYERRRMENLKKPCPICGKPIQPTSTYCPAHKSLLYAGSNHYGWKGGRTKTTKGYILVKNPSHHRAQNDGYVFEHIVVWEETHKKPLPKGYVIHHLNGITGDNRPQNLIAMPSRKHSLVLQAKAKRIQELEALLNGQGHLI